MNIFGEDNEHQSLWAIEVDKFKQGTTKAQIVPEGKGDEFKPLIHNGVPHDDIGYFSSRDGRILSIKRGSPKILSPKRSRSPDKNSDRSKYIKPSNVNLTVPKGYYKDYEYVADKGGSGKVSKNITKPNVRFHRVTIETWKPFEEWCHEADPPIPLDDWDNTPESVKKFVLESYYVDHIDDDTSNANLDNLRYCTPPRNSNYRKGKSGGPI